MKRLLVVAPWGEGVPFLLGQCLFQGRDLMSRGGGKVTRVEEQTARRDREALPLMRGVQGSPSAWGPGRVKAEAPR